MYINKSFEQPGFVLHALCHGRSNTDDLPKYIFHNSLLSWSEVIPFQMYHEKVISKTKFRIIIRPLQPNIYIAILSEK